MRTPRSCRQRLVAFAVLWVISVAGCDVSPSAPPKHLSDSAAESAAAKSAGAHNQLAENPGRSRDEALKRAHAALDPGPAVTLPARPLVVDPERGKAFYLANCAVCHDADGRGRTRTDLVDNDGNPISPRDFTQGYFKGGSSLEELAMRIYRGMPGTPMPAHADISGEDLWSVAAYVSRFIPSPEDMAPLVPCPTSR
jgi:high-affinity iron transporter